MKFIFAVAAFVAAVTAQDMAGINQCGKDCISGMQNKATVEFGCASGNVGCQCGDARFARGLSDCSGQACGAGQQSLVVAYGQAYCAAGGAGGAGSSIASGASSAASSASGAVSSVASSASSAANSAASSASNAVSSAASSASSAVSSANASGSSKAASATGSGASGSATGASSSGFAMRTSAPVAGALGMAALLLL